MLRQALMNTGTAFVFALLASSCLIVTGANAAVITFQGGDAGANSTDPRPISTATAASFDAAAGGLGAGQLITFESAPLGGYSSLVVAPGVTLTGTDYTGNSAGQSILNAPYSSPDSLFGYNTTLGGTKYAFINGGFITFSFTSPIQAFGVYLSGLQLDSETINFNDGSSQSLGITNLGSGVQFFGFTDAGSLISSIVLNTTSSASPLGDFVAADDVRFVLSAPVSAIPEPLTISLFGTGLAGAIALRRRKKAA